jgi:hypothetical protein
MTKSNLFFKFKYQIVIILITYFSIKRLIDPQSCNPRWGPRYNIKCDSCSNDTVSGYGTTAFSKIRIDIKTLKVISDDFTFSNARYGSPVPFGIAGDCYSKNPECIQV